MTRTKRFLWILLACSIQAVYGPTSARTYGGIEPRLSIDIFPVWPVWVVPYVLCYLLWSYGILWAIFKTEDRKFLTFAIAFIITGTISVATFLLFPTYVPQAELTGRDLFTSLLRYIHENYGRYNALPSGHIYITALLVFFFSRWHPHRRPVWILVLIVVSLSTLFTGQHYILDIAAGLLVAYIGFSLGLKWAALSPLGIPTPKKRPAGSPPS